MSAQPDQMARLGWQVRAMRARDLDSVAAIEHDIYPFPWTRGNFQDSLKAGYDAWVFEQAGSIIGYSVLMWAPEELHVLNLSVAAGRQSQGLGRAMLRWLCEDARARGAVTLMLEVRPSNTRALALYQSAAFRSIGVRKRYYPSYDETREDAWVLVRDLRNE